MEASIQSASQHTLAMRHALVINHPSERERLGAATSAVRVLTPGSGLGRLAFDIAEEFAGSEVVAVEPDVHSQLL